MKFNRRNFLWATFGTGTAIAASQEHLRLNAIRQQQEQNQIARSSLSDQISLIDAAYASEADWEDEMAKRGFLAQLEDTLLNHVVDTYQTALKQGAEMNQPDLPLQQLKI